MPLIQISLQQLATLIALLVWAPLEIAAASPSKNDVAMASISGRVTILGLVDALHDQKLSASERKNFYMFYLRQQLDPVGLTTPESMLQAMTQGVERTKKAVGEEKLEAVSRGMRNPYQKPFVDGSKVQISESEKKAIQEFFNLNYTAGNTALESGTLDSLTRIDLGSIMLGNMKISLDTWTSGRIVTEVSHPKLFQLVVTSLQKTIARLSEDETMINEAWKEAVSDWLKK
jgi:hypothetical protein